MIGIRHFTRMLEARLREKFPELKISLYTSKTKEHMHMGLDVALFAYTRHDQLIYEIKNFRMLSYDIEEKYIVLFPMHIGSTKWKYDHIMKRRKEFLFFFSLVF